MWHRPAGNTLFRRHVRARRTRRVASATATAQSSLMFRFINKNLTVGSAEMADVSRDIGVGVVGQPVPHTSFDIYRESHHLLALGGSIGMRSSLKHETWGRRGSHLRMCVDFLGVSLSFLSLSFFLSCTLHANCFFVAFRETYSIVGHICIFGATRPEWHGVGYIDDARYEGHVGLMFEFCVILWDDFDEQFILLPIPRYSRLALFFRSFNIYRNFWTLDTLNVKFALLRYLRFMLRHTGFSIVIFCILAWILWRKRYKTIRKLYLFKQGNSRRAQ